MAGRHNDDVATGGASHDEFPRPEAPADDERRPRARGGIGAAAAVTLVAIRSDSGSTPVAAPAVHPAAAATVSLPTTVRDNEGTEASVTTLSDPQGHVRTPRELTAGPDGSLWFTADHGQVGRITPGGKFSVYSDPAGRIAFSDSIITGSDGAMWFTTGGRRRRARHHRRRDDERPGRQRRPGGPARPGGGPDGNIWFTTAR